MKRTVWILILAILAVAAFGCDMFIKREIKRVVLVTYEKPTETDLFNPKLERDPGKDQDYWQFRSPSLIVTPKGSVLAFCEAWRLTRNPVTNRLDEDDSVDIVYKRSMDGGETWGPLRLVYVSEENDGLRVSNPCPVVDVDTETIWLAFTINNKRVRMIQSKNDGMSWLCPNGFDFPSDDDIMPPEDITRDVISVDWEGVSSYSTGPGVGVQISQGDYEGRLVIPCKHDEEIKKQTVSRAHVIYSDDHGANWQAGESVDFDTRECQVVELDGGDLMINAAHWMDLSGVIWTEELRPKMGRLVSMSDSGGEDWSRARFDEKLIDPFAQASLLRYSGASDGGGRDRLIFCNPATRNEMRYVTARLSHDNGKTWAYSKLLYDGPSERSSMVKLPGDLVGCLFEAGKTTPHEKLVLKRFSIAWLSGGADSSVF